MTPLQLHDRALRKQGGALAEIPAAILNNPAAADRAGFRFVEHELAPGNGQPKLPALQHVADRLCARVRGAGRLRGQPVPLRFAACGARSAGRKSAWRSTSAFRSAPTEDARRLALWIRYSMGGWR